jgi:hypothetical protein
LIVDETQDTGPLPERATTALYWGILIVAAVLRLLSITYRELWFDEIVSVQMVLSPLSHTLRGDGGNPPLYFLLMKPWVALFGCSALAVRLPSAMASLLSVAFLRPLLRDLGLPSGATLWATALAAVAPMHIYYAQEARCYAIGVLLLELAIWAFARAIRTNSRSSWVVHGLSLTALLYTHNLGIPMVGAFWLAGWVLFVDRGKFRELLKTHACVAVAYSFWLPHIFDQSHASSIDWIRYLWAGVPPWKHIPLSLQTLLGGWMPRLVSMPDAGPVVAYASSFMLIVLGLFAAVAPLKRQALALTVFLLTPLLFMLTYSVLVRPIYVVGRYDTFAFPGFLGLAGLGAWSLQGALKQWGGLSGWFTPIILFVLFMVSADWPRFEARLTDPAPRIYTTYYEMLAKLPQTGDSILALYLDKPIVDYARALWDFKTPAVEYPTKLPNVTGKGGLPWVLQNQRPALEQELAQTLRALESAPGSSGRIWIAALMENGAAISSTPDQQLFVQIIKQVLQKENFRDAWPNAQYQQLGARIGLLPVKRVTQPSGSGMPPRS